MLESAQKKKKKSRVSENLSRGRLGGRPKGLTKQAAHKAIIAACLYKKQKLSIAQICAQLGISKPTLI